jgi:hypothetical protein
MLDAKHAAIGGSPFVQVTLPDGTSDQVYGFDSREAASEWIETEQRGWLRGRQSKKIGDTRV